MTPAGNPGNDGTVVATLALSPGGAQQWMWEMVLGLTSPLKLASTRSTWSTGSSSTSAVPVPDESFGGSSAAPLSMPVNVAAPTGRLPATKIITALATLIDLFIPTPPSQRLICLRAHHIARRCCKFRKVGWSTRLGDASLLPTRKPWPVWARLVTASIIPSSTAQGITPEPLVTGKTVMVHRVWQRDASPGWTQMHIELVREGYAFTRRRFPRVVQHRATETPRSAAAAFRARRSPTGPSRSLCVLVSLC